MAHPVSPASEKAIHLPSGDQVGSPAESTLVTGLWSLPSAFMTSMLGTNEASSFMNAIFDPSGDQAGPASAPSEAIPDWSETSTFMKRALLPAARQLPNAVSEQSRGHT